MDDPECLDRVTSVSSVLQCCQSYLPELILISLPPQPSHQVDCSPLDLLQLLLVCLEVG